MGAKKPGLFLHLSVSWHQRSEKPGFWSRGFWYRAGAIANIEENERRQEIAACTQVLAGLRFKKDLLANFFWEEIMQESGIYQDMFQKGYEVGYEQGKKEGMLSIVKYQIRKHFVTVPDVILQCLNSLTTDQLENLSGALLSFTNLVDLFQWLDSTGKIPVPTD